jgi:hypothetical protein
MPIDFPGLGPDDFGGSDDPDSGFETGWDRHIRHERAVLRHRDQ